MNLLKKIFSPTILIISFLLFFYTFYKSEIIWDGDNRNYYKTYYLVSSILICFSIITFFINQKIKEYLVIIIISFISTLYLFQGYLTFYPKIKNEMAYKKETKKKWDRRTKKEIYNDFSASNDNVSLAIPLNAYLDNTKPSNTSWDTIDYILKHTENLTHNELDKMSDTQKMQLV